jgi:hypothetical protein
LPIDSIELLAEAAARSISTARRTLDWEGLRAR